MGSADNYIIYSDGDYELDNDTYADYLSGTWGSWGWFNLLHVSNTLIMNLELQEFHTFADCYTANHCYIITIIDFKGLYYILK